MNPLAIEILEQFEVGLDTRQVSNSSHPAEIIGYGEISTVFALAEYPSLAIKRMPIFAHAGEARRYLEGYELYCSRLRAAGLNLPGDTTAIVNIPDHPVTLYIGQERYPAKRLAHKLIHTLPADMISEMFMAIVAAISKIWQYNHSNIPDIELALDGQLSNWVWLEEDHATRLHYIDTGTPLYKIDGREQLDPELLLKSVPGFLRWLIRWLFLDDVMNRYYKERSVYIDLVANLYKEQRADLIPLAIEIINTQLSAGQVPLNEKEIQAYYREDKLIWTLFLMFRRIDRWIQTVLLRKRYDYILPGPTKR